MQSIMPSRCSAFVPIAVMAIDLMFLVLPAARRIKRLRQPTKFKAKEGFIPQSFGAAPSGMDSVILKRLRSAAYIVWRIYEREQRFAESGIDSDRPERLLFR
jgi:hypothetical protein